MSNFSRLAPALAATACWLVAARAGAQFPEQNLLLGEAKSRKIQPVPVDPRLPRGAELPARLERPVSPEPPACSFRLPVCVHRGAGVAPATALAALAALERAYLRLVVALGLPTPLDDLGAGGSSALDLYLQAGHPPSVAVEHDFISLGAWDQAAAFCVVGADADLERASHLCVGEAIGWRLDASTAPGVRRAYASHLWWTVGQPSDEDAEAIDDVQRHPEQGLVGEAPPLAEGAGVFLEYLDTRRGTAGPAFLSSGLLAIAAGKTPSDAWQWHNEPDVFDVLRATSGKSPDALARLMGDFAVARAFTGSRDDGRHLSSLGWSGELGRVRFDWVIPFSSLPRRVASLFPIEPTGSVYVWLDIDDVPEGAALGFRAQWEPPAAFQWTLVRVAADGRELARLHAPYKEKGVSTDLRLDELAGTRGVIVVGTNLGGISVAHPFDPDVRPFEPHSCTVYLAKL